MKNMNERTQLINTVKRAPTVDRGSVLEDRAIPLTEDVIQDMSKSFEWILNRNLTEAQRNQLRQQLIQDCSGDPRQAAAYKDSMRKFKQLQLADASTQESWRKRNVPVFIEGLRQKMDNSRFAYDLVYDYDQANRPPMAPISLSTSTGHPVASISLSTNAGPPVAPASLSTSASPLVTGGLALLGALGTMAVSAILKSGERSSNPALKLGTMAVSALLKSGEQSSNPALKLGTAAVSEILKKSGEKAGNPALKDLEKAFEPDPPDEESDPQLAIMKRMQKQQDDIRFVRDVGNQLHEIGMISTRW